MALAARKRVRIAAEMFEVDPAFRGDIADAGVGLFAARRQSQDLERLGDDVAHGHARAKRGVGVLEDQLRMGLR